MLFRMKYQSPQLDAPSPPTVAHMLLILLRQSVIIKYNLSYKHVYRNRLSCTACTLNTMLLLRVFPHLTIIHMKSTTVQNPRRKCSAVVETNCLVAQYRIPYHIGPRTIITHVHRTPLIDMGWAMQRGPRPIS